MAKKKKITITTVSGEKMVMDATEDCQVAVKITGMHLTMNVENIGKVQIEEVEV